MSKMERIMEKRRKLLAAFKAQHRKVHPDRNKTAGKIYENTRELEAECDRIAREDYAAAWVDRWPL